MPLTLRAYAVIAASLLLVSVACGGGAKDTGLPKGPTQEPTIVKGVVHATKANTFEPKQITIKVGDEVTWMFAPSHNAEAEDGAFNSHKGCGPSAIDKCSKDNDVFKFKFTNAGQIPYICVIHGFKGGFGMAGTVIVEA
jgi:plastocyanin